MDISKILSGEQIVAKGIIKIEATLPESGLKDVAPNGSWLEQKQIQAALEARKHLIAVERIEKCGTLSHAEWREDIMLAEVTQKSGGHWHYYGHNVGSKLFLNPEEALFLIETNCLQLKHDGITVSLQKAYSLLLRGTISITQYKVFASLSRLGYKVYKHKVSTKNRYSSKESDCHNVIETNSCVSENNVDREDNIPESGSKEDGKKSKMDCDGSASQLLGDSGCFAMEEDVQEDIENTECRENAPGSTISGQTMDTEGISHSEDNGKYILKQENTAAIHNTTVNIGDAQKPYYVSKLEKLRHRLLIPTDAKKLFKHFEGIPDLFQKQVFTLNAPEQELVPKNVFVNKSSYTLSLQNIRMKTVRPVLYDTPTYSTTDEVNGDHVRRIRNISNSETSFNQNPRFPRQNFNFRPFNFWRPQNNLNYYQFSMFYQRPVIPNMYFLPRFQFNANPNPFLRQIPINSNNNARKRTRNCLKSSQLRGIKALAAKLKQLVMSGNTQMQNVQALHRLISSYNMKYKTRLRLSDSFDVINDEIIIDTIELDDDEESKSKKPRLEAQDNMLNENLNRLRQLALKLKELETKHKATARHRRAFSNTLRTLNKSYDTDFYLSTDYEVLDRRYINLDSSSESDCIVEETKIKARKNKLLRNPFNMMKERSSKISTSDIPSTSKENIHNQETTNHITKYNEFITKTFNNKWLPNENDFGRAEIVPKLQTHTNFTDSCKDEYLYDFMNEQRKKYNNWLDAKISFLKHMEDANIAFQQNELDNNVQEVSYTGLRPLIGTEDRYDMPSVLEKLRIIKNNNDINADTSLGIDFDVYHKDVQNFRKSNPPKPHFRVICMHESSTFPSAADVLALHSKYNDDIPILFAIVNVSSVSYLQIIPTDLPIYIRSND